MVDDSAVLRAVVRAHLAGEPFEVVEAGDGLAAAELLDDLRPDVVLCDVMMPGLDGFGLLERVKAHPALAHVPVVFLTALDDPADLARGLDAGAHDWLRKPFEPLELIARVRAAVRVKELQDELRERNDELERLASVDDVTQLFNRRFVEEELRRAVSRANRHAGDVAVVIADIDHFKAINDRHGHLTGDAVLREVAQRLRGRLRLEDLLGRWGGDEMLLVSSSAGPIDARRLCEALLATIGDEPVPTPVGPVPVTLSVGWAHHRRGESAADLLARADAALYEAKEAGRATARGAAP